MSSAPEDVYREFFKADQRRDPAAWAAVMHYPHVRVAAPGRTELFKTAKDYAKHASWTARAATGWVRTEGIEPIRASESNRKIHLAGGWTRLNANDEPILENRVAYVLTTIDGRWGVQARFACGAKDNWREVDATPALESLDRALRALRENRIGTFVELVRYPCTLVDVGVVRQFTSGAALNAWFAKTDAVAISNWELRALHAGPSGANVAAKVHFTDGGVQDWLVLLARSNEGWNIAALSMGLS